MAITKIQSESLNLSDTYAFTGTVTGAGGVMTPAFYARAASHQSVSDNTTTKVTLGTEDFDSDGKFADSRFTPTVAGKYFIFGHVFFDPGNADDLVYGVSYIYKNGSQHNAAKLDFRNNAGRDATVQISSIIDLDSNDYVELYGTLNSADGSGQVFYASHYTFFGGYKIIE